MIMEKLKVKTSIFSDKELCEANGMKPSKLFLNEDGSKSISFEVLDFQNNEVVEKCPEAQTMVLLNSSYLSNDETNYGYNCAFCFKSDDEAKAFVWYETVLDSKNTNAQFFVNELSKNFVGCYIQNANGTDDYKEAKFYTVKHGYLAPLPVKKEDLQKSAEQIFREVFLNLEEEKHNESV
jgi:hypothetical protein